jgi:hypothetical protein
MRIDNELLHFCADKTREIVAAYDKFCVFPGEKDGFPRSVDDLHTLVWGHYGKPIHHRLLRIKRSSAKYRSFYITFDDRCEIYYPDYIDIPGMRYYKSKELMQLHLMQEAYKTKDIVGLVQNMILRASPESVELDLGHAALTFLRFSGHWIKRLGALPVRG